jgi:toxin-antitoxin system PIN domain toxin
MLIDANILLYAVDRDSPWNEGARRWLDETLNGTRRIGIAWSGISAFLRIATHPRAAARPLTPNEAWAYVDEWLATSTVWIPTPTERHAQVLGDLVVRHQLRGNLIPDADLAALAIEHGLSIRSADTDFARFPEVRWENPLGAEPAGGHG